MLLILSVNSLGWSRVLSYTYAKIGPYVFVLELSVRLCLGIPPSPSNLVLALCLKPVKKEHSKKRIISMILPLLIKARSAFFPAR